jgi:hypothetical protein
MGHAHSVTAIILHGSSRASNVTNGSSPLHKR